MPIRRIAGQRHRHPVAGFEGREKGQHEARRRAGRDDDTLGLDIDAVPLGISARNAPPQRGDAERLGIAVRASAQRRAHGRDRRRRRADRRLADLHMHDPAALRLEPRRGRHDVHDHERRHAAAAGGRNQAPMQQAFGLFEHQSALELLVKLRSQMRAQPRPHGRDSAPLMPHSAVFLPRRRLAALPGVPTRVLTETLPIHSLQARRRDLHA